MATRAGGDGSPTPMMEQYHQLKHENPEALLMFRLGDFYELFHDDARIAAPVLDVQLTSRDGQVPMCGIPHHALMTYLQKLMSAGFHVALAEQMEDPKLTKGLVKRQVVRTFSPSTFVAEESSVVPRLAVLYRDSKGWALAISELATGTLFVTEASGFDKSALIEEWNLWHPDEFLTNWDLAEIDSHGGKIVGEQWFRGVKAGLALERELANRLGTASVSGWGLTTALRAQKALGVLFRYLDYTQQRTVQHWSTVHVIDRKGGMRLSPHALRSLDVLGDEGPTLLRLLDETKTAMGARRLEFWLTHPLAQADLIAERSDHIRRWQADPVASAFVSEALTKVGDLERRISRLSLGLGYPRDLVGLHAGLTAYERVADRAREVGDLLPELGERLGQLQMDLATLREDAPVKWDGGDLYRDGIDPDLDRARAVARDQRQALAALEQEERERSGVRTLKVGYHRTFGYYLEVTRSQVGKVPEDWRKRQTMTKSERYTSDRLLALESEILGAEERAVQIERERVQALLADVTAVAPALNRAAQALAELDVVTTFAGLVSRWHYVWPEWVENATVEFVGLRHPVLERVIDQYVPTDFCPEPGKRLMVITGPNMGGKSTFMRAVALSVLLAHSGMAVPAKVARMPVMDAIYTRIGADDHLFRGQSTFMAELEDVALILRRSTAKSLVLLDELGRGTSTYDGLAIASAVVEHLAQESGPFTLFATHYHELIELADRRATVENWSVEVVTEANGGLTFSHRVISGPCNRSFGIEVAELAGLPRSVLDKARTALRRWQANGPSAPTVEQLSLLAPDPLSQELSAALRALDLDRYSPRQTWQWIADWQARWSSSTSTDGGEPVGEEI